MREGRKSEGKIRPIRVEFQSATDRETACRNVYQLKDSDRFRYTASISRDKIREDREQERAKYHEMKRRNNTINGPGQPGNQVEVGSEATTTTSARDAENISALLTDLRPGTSTTVGVDTTDPHMEGTEHTP